MIVLGEIMGYVYCVFDICTRNGSQEDTGFFRTRKFREEEESDSHLFSPNLGLEEEDAADAVSYKKDMELRNERLDKQKFVKDRKEEDVDQDSQALLDSLEDITNSKIKSNKSQNQVR